MRIIFVREQDYWIFPVTFLAVIFNIVFLYVGIFSVRFICGLLGIGGLAFITYIVDKNYGKKLARRYLIICILSILITYGVMYYLTR